MMYAPFNLNACMFGVLKSSELVNSTSKGLLTAPSHPIPAKKLFDPIVIYPPSSAVLFVLVICNKASVPATPEML